MGRHGHITANAEFMTFCAEAPVSLAVFKFKSCGFVAQGRWFKATNHLIAKAK